MRQTVDVRLINGLWIRFPIYRVRIKPERNCVDFRLMLGLLFGDCPNVVRLYQRIERVWSFVWFYFIIIFIIKFVLMVFDMKFVSDGL